MNNLIEHPGIARVLATGYPYAPKRSWARKDWDAPYEQRREKLLFPGQDGSPCESCWRQQDCQEGCQLWREAYLSRQKRINAYGKAAWRGEKSRENADVFTYSHPDHVRRYAKTHPCRGCAFEISCVTPCGRYLHWYDLRMELARKRSCELGIRN